MELRTIKRRISRTYPPWEATAWLLPLRTEGLIRYRSSNSPEMKTMKAIQVRSLGQECNSNPKLSSRYSIWRRNRRSKWWQPHRSLNPRPPFCTVCGGRSNQSEILTGLVPVPTHSWMTRVRYTSSSRTLRWTTMTWSGFWWLPTRTL